MKKEIYIKSIELENFIHFNKIESEFSPNINIIVGINETGKTNFIKLLYSTIKAWERSCIDNRKTFKQFLNEKIYNVFNLTKKGIGSLVDFSSNQELNIKLFFNDSNNNFFENIEYQFGNSAINTIKPEKIKDIKSSKDLFNTIFIPAKELLSFWDIIKISEDKFPTGFDDTVFDLFKKLNLPQQIGYVNNELIEANIKIEKLINGKMEFLNENGNTRFVFKKQGGGTFEMEMTAEGIKQLGMLSTLIQNREINESTILFLDEPDSNLHPKATRELANILLDLSKAGTQIFLTSHNYFLIKQLMIAAKKNPEVLVNCFNITKNIKNQKMDIEKFDLKQGIPMISIVEEALKMYDEEIDLDF